MNYILSLTEDEINGTISFILNHERDDIPDDVWDAMDKMREIADRW